MKSTTAKAPAGLCVEAQRFWRKVIEEFTVDDVGSLRVLASACESFDRMLQARDVISKEGLTCVDRFGQCKAHPAVLIERDARQAMLNALKQLKLEVNEPQQARQAGRQAGVALLSERRKAR
jgi:P27 family predicted phage terminase small subunit